MNPIDEENIRNKAWFDCLSAALGTTQLTHALAKIESLSKNMQKSYGLGTNFNVKKISVVLSNGADRISIHTDLPRPFVKEWVTQPLILDFEATRDKGVDYVRNIFGVEPEIANVRH